ncbi:hypothetical protein KIPB_004994, partial [Kipferlia bialata]|eukprot:g4994.t1
MCAGDDPIGAFERAHLCALCPVSPFLDLHKRDYPISRSGQACSAQLFRMARGLVLSKHRRSQDALAAAEGEGDKEREAEEFDPDHPMLGGGPNGSLSVSVLSELFGLSSAIVTNLLMHYPREAADVPKEEEGEALPIETEDETAPDTIPPEEVELLRQQEEQNAQEEEVSEDMDTALSPSLS